MEYFVFYGVFAVFILAYVILTDLDSQEEIRISLFVAIFCIVSFFVVMDEVKNPSIYNHYIGKVDDKRIETRTETYRCGDSTCTRTVKEYFLYSKIRGNQTCKQEVSYSTYKSTVIGETVACSNKFPNYMLLDKEKFKTTKLIKDQYKKIILERYDFELKKHRFIYFDPNLLNELRQDDNSSTDYWILNDKMLEFLDNKPYIVNVFITKERDINVVSALTEEWNGANPEEVVLVYSLEKDGDNYLVNWSNIQTHANNDENEYFVASFHSRHLTKPKFNKELFDEDLKFIDENYKNISPMKFKDLSESYNTATKNWVLIIALVLVGCIFFFLHRVFEPRRF